MSKSRGVIITILRNIWFILKESLLDGKGYLFLKGQLENKNILLGSLYMPNDDQSIFWPPSRKGKSSWGGSAFDRKLLGRQDSPTSPTRTN